jgi:hypothetical protein
MKNKLIILGCSVAITLLLIMTAYINREDRISGERTNYSTLLEMQAAKDLPAAGPLAEIKEASFRDKSFSKGEDASPTLSAG